jgi:methionine synthase II (cobalamin-independent)
MAKYPKYTTTVIGAHSAPDWYEALDRLVAVGQLSMASMADAQHRASQAAILDQEIANIDVRTDVGLARSRPRTLSGSKVRNFVDGVVSCLRWIQDYGISAVPTIVA